MIYSPKKVFAEGWLKNIADPVEQIQQNGIDLTLASIARLGGKNTLTKKDRSHCERTLMANNDSIEMERFVYLEPGSYEVLYNEEFDVPNGCAASILTRSTLIRGGSYLASGLYDAGFKGIGGGVLHITQPTVLEIGVRIGQVVFYQAEEGDLYEGVYNTATSL